MRVDVCWGRWNMPSALTSQKAFQQLCSHYAVAATALLNPTLPTCLSTSHTHTQVLRDSLKRATVSIKANRHDTGVDGTGDFATIDLLVDLAQKHR